MQTVRQLWRLSSQNLCLVKNWWFKSSMPWIYFYEISPFNPPIIVANPSIPKPLTWWSGREYLGTNKHTQTSCSWNGFPIYHARSLTGSLYWLCIFQQGSNATEIMQVQLHGHMYYAFLTTFLFVWQHPWCILAFCHFLLSVKLPHGLCASRYFKRIFNRIDWRKIGRKGKWFSKELYVIPFVLKLGKVQSRATKWQNLRSSLDLRNDWADWASSTWKRSDWKERWHKSADIRMAHRSCVKDVRADWRLLCFFRSEEKWVLWSTDYP